MQVYSSNAYTHYPTPKKPQGNTPHNGLGNRTTVVTKQYYTPQPDETDLASASTQGSLTGTASAINPFFGTTIGMTTLSSPPNTNRVVVVEKQTVNY